MTDFLFQMGLSNACFSLALAIVAMIVGATAKRPHLAHLLWLLVFVKLVTPPIVTIPVGMPASDCQHMTTCQLKCISRSFLMWMSRHSRDRPGGSSSFPDVHDRSQVECCKTMVRLHLVTGKPSSSSHGQCVESFNSPACCRRNTEPAPQPSADGCGHDREAVGTEHSTGNSHDLRSPFAHGVVGWRESANRRSGHAAGRNGCKAVAVDSGTRVGPRTATRLPGPVARVAGVCLLLVESCGLVGTAQPARHGRDLL